jgi:hypothetical protein
MGRQNQYQSETQLPSLDNREYSLFIPYIFLNKFGHTQSLSRFKKHMEEENVL